MRQVGERLAERGHRVTVATSYLPERNVRELKGVSIKEFRISGNLGRGMTGDIDAYRKYALTSDFDVFLVKAAQQWTLDALLPILDKLKMRTVFIPCGFSGFYDPAYAEYFRRMPDVLREFDQLIFYATDYRDINFARQHGLTNISIVPNGASEREFNVPRDSSFRWRHGIPDDAFVILTVGSLTGFKGHSEVADAFNRASFGDKEAVLLLNGNRVSPPHLSQRVVALTDALCREYRVKGLAGTLRLVLDKLLARFTPRGSESDSSSGLSVPLSLEEHLAEINQRGSNKLGKLVDLPRSELIQAYLNSDLFVFASNIEYSPLVLFEAAAAGLPFISVPVGNAEEIARWTGGGETCPAARDELGYTRVDPLVLADYISRLAAKPDKLKAFQETGRKNWSERFTWEKITGLYEEIFIRLLSEEQRHV